jgi:hypothetical protein
MTDEVQNANQNEGTVVPGEVTPLMEEALSQGWVPKTEYEGDPDRFVDYAEFVRRGELFRKIESQSKEMKELKRALKELATHNTKIREVEYQRAVEALKAEKKAALNEGDADKVVEIDDRIDLVKEQQRVLQQQQVQEIAEPAVHPELQNWINNNQWYESNRTMRGWADARGVELASEGLSPREVLTTLTKEVKQRFAEKFSNPNRDKPGAVEGQRSRATATKSETAFELSDVERQIMRRIVDTGVITEADYISQLKATKNS